MIEEPTVRKLIVALGFDGKANLNLERNKEYINRYLDTEVIAYGFSPFGFNAIFKAYQDDYVGINITVYNMVSGWKHITSQVVPFQVMEKELRNVGKYKTCEYWMNIDKVNKISLEKAKEEVGTILLKNKKTGDTYKQYRFTRFKNKSIRVEVISGSTWKIIKRDTFYTEYNYYSGDSYYADKYEIIKNISDDILEEIKQEVIAKEI